MSSYPPGAGRHTATAAAAGAATYGIDLEIELLKPQSASIRTYSSASSSPNSTLSESSTSLSPALSICTRKPRTARKRPNQTYNEAAALLSTAYPNVFSPKHLSKPPSFKFAKPTDSPAWLNGDDHDLLLPNKPFEPRLGLLTCTTFSDDADDKPYPSPMDEKDNGGLEDDDFDTKSILDEEVGGIDSIMGNLTVRGDINQHHQQTDTFCYGLPMGLGLGLGLLGGRFDFGFGLTRGVSAFRNSPIAGYGGAGEWWGYPAMTTVDVQAISPTLDKKPALDKKAKSTKKKKKAPAPDENMNAKDDKQTEASVAPVAPPPTASESRIQLKLDYDDVLSAWSDRGSPFSDDSPASELRGRDVEARLAQIDLFGDNEEREARVQRYKDKRRNRLFSKKIRYQVRKVNADQRPRMKGRFVRSPESSSGGAQT